MNNILKLYSISKSVIIKLKRLVQLNSNSLSAWQISYAQSGEDIIVNSIFNQLKIITPTYIDIGAHHPEYLSNTYFFYKKGYRGICIEPDPLLYKMIQKKRKNDICLNVGIGKANEKLDFYIFSSRTLNTFSRETAYNLSKNGSYKIQQTLKIPVIKIDDVIVKYLANNSPNFISIDVEGLDFDIISSFNFSKWRPEIFCIETLTFSENKTEQKISSIIEFMNHNNYFVYADTYINTIFVDNQAWINRD